MEKGEKIRAYRINLKGLNFPIKAAKHYPIWHKKLLTLHHWLRDVSTWATGATAVAPKSSDALTLFQPGGADSALPFCRGRTINFPAVTSLCCKGHQCGLTYMAVRLSDISPKTGKKCIFCVFRPFLSICRTASRPYRLSHIDALRNNQSY